MMTRQTLVYMTLLATVGLAACGGAPGAGPTSDSTGPTSATTAPATATAEASLPLTVPATAVPTPTPTVDALQFSYPFTLTEAGGYTFSGTLMLGKLEHFGAGIRQGPLEAGSACTINATTDAIVPGTLSMTNTTSGFPAPASLGVGWKTPMDPLVDPISGIEAWFSGGPQCENGSDGLTVESTGDLAPGASVATEFFVVLSNFFSPNEPSGDPSLLAQAKLTVQGWVIPGTSAVSQVSSMSGPDLSGSGEAGWDPYTIAIQG